MDVIINPMVMNALTETVGTTTLWGAGAILLTLIAGVVIVGIKMEKKRGGKQDETLELG